LKCPGKIVSEFHRIKNSTWQAVTGVPQLNRRNREVSSRLNGTDRYNWTGGVKISRGKEDRGNERRGYKK
jgi:hypothetical protein